MIRPAQLLSVVCLAAQLVAAENALENFESHPPGNVPAGWQAVFQGPGSALWAIHTDTAAASGRHVLKQTGWAPKPGFPICTLTNPATRLQDGFVQVKFRPESGTNDQAAGVVWRFQDASNYYIARANALENNVVLYKVQDGKRTSLDIVGRQGGYGVKAEVPAQKWSTLRVDFSGPLFQVQLNGTNLFVVQDRSFSGRGQVGVWTKADSITSFDDFQVGTAK